MLALPKVTLRQRQVKQLALDCTTHRKKAWGLRADPGARIVSYHGTVEPLSRCRHGAACRPSQCFSRCRTQPRWRVPEPRHCLRASSL